MLPLKCKALGSSKSCPPICRSSWRTSCSIATTRRKWSGFIQTAHWSSDSSRLTAVDAVTCLIQKKCRVVFPCELNCTIRSEYNPLGLITQQQPSRNTDTYVYVGRHTVIQHVLQAESLTACNYIEHKDFAYRHCLNMEVYQSSQLLTKLDI